MTRDADDAMMLSFIRCAAFMLPPRHHYATANTAFRFRHERYYYLLAVTDYRFTRHGYAISEGMVARATLPHAAVMLSPAACRCCCVRLRLRHAMPRAAMPRYASAAIRYAADICRAPCHYASAAIDAALLDVMTPFALL